MNRRGFFSAIAAAVAGASLDPERLLWVPGQKLISIPRRVPMHWPPEYQEAFARDFAVAMEPFARHFAVAMHDALHAFEWDDYEATLVAGHVGQISTPSPSAE